MSYRYIVVASNWCWCKNKIWNSWNCAQKKQKKTVKKLPSLILSLSQESVECSVVNRTSLLGETVTKEEQCFSRSTFNKREPLNFRE